MKYNKALIYDWFDKRISFNLQNKTISGKVKTIARNPITEEITLKIENKSFVFGEPTKIGKLNSTDYVFIYGGNNLKSNDDDFYLKLKELNEKGLGVDNALRELNESEDLYIFFTLL